ncbi:hypothetical protein GCM10022243_49250 [Saccharothrix violaceirubra]|uniref:Uncharacterized protein n=1 Tax=Saccharothrix violaceirubra TaxID=413306 RepID=A0A7W7SZW3_9PSEU|nr:hypothetical protein [Saccharothrix violaceirubra]MBB4963731.1 hypothetical protein [Saccharothrix violaceirubra]
MSDPSRYDPVDLWDRMLAAKQVVEEFEAGVDPGEQVAAFLYDLKLALNGDVLRDEITGELMRFRPGHGQALTALLAAGREAS